MSDARSLLRRAKAAESEKRINHPLALYNASGQLRCAACGTTVKPHAWEGHVISKAHRTQAARLRAEEEKEQAKKRKAEENAEMEDADEGKRPRTAEPEPAPPQLESTGGLPVDFFSDPSRAPVLGGDDDGDDQEMSSDPVNRESTLDDEFAAFSKAVLQPALKPAALNAYESATVFAEPELVNNVPDGFPAGVTGEAEGETQEVVEETEEEKRQRLQEEERELIMDRLRDEEMAQEEADERVTRLKARLEAVRAGKAQGTAAPAPGPASGVDKKTLLKMLRGKKKPAAS
ncbi:hypothetical protein BN14_02523 [Rhizoctonia solani AG-1 IB]|uniref:Coiled-coil domain-containing protein 16 n=1 Tax=Thanatephorus cucumeris (strain AG1-IB / isolate 7/3/14) TaxID=1108050 RepID=M5BM12_THACB|nr:hypothetical protein BN14_02523 [Rhizoctonia solani AG-1 IB]